jgi:putative SOS response-associated peptidase YedK
MPVILAPEDYTLWLDPAVSDPVLAAGLLRPFPPEEMAFHPVSTRVNAVRNDDPGCIMPIVG